MDKQKYLDKFIKLEKEVKRLRLTNLDNIENFINKHKNEYKNANFVPIKRVAIQQELFSGFVLAFYADKTIQELENELKNLDEKELRKKETGKKISEGLKKYWAKEKVKIEKRKVEAERRKLEAKAKADAFKLKKEQEKELRRWLSEPE